MDLTQVDVEPSEASEVGMEPSEATSKESYFASQAKSAESKEWAKELVRDGDRKARALKRSATFKADQRFFHDKHGERRQDQPFPSLTPCGLHASLTGKFRDLFVLSRHDILRSNVTFNEVEQIDGNVIIQIIDDGAGMSQQFVRDRLFRPFDSTKGVEGMGIGAYQAREFARKLGGDLRVISEPDRGTTVAMTLPCS